MMYSTVFMSRVGQPKGDKRARTRAALIAAAAETVAEKGFEGASLEEVARRAGMTRGAIYGNFRNREELFVAVAESRWSPIIPAVTPGMTYAERMRALGEAVVAALPARRAAAVGAASFTLYALRNAELRRRLADTNAGIYAQTAEAIRATGGEADLPMPIDDFVRMTHGVIEGLVQLANLTPELVTPEVVRASFEALARITPP